MVPSRSFRLIAPVFAAVAAGALLAGATSAGAADPGECPAWNPPNTLKLDGGTPQIAKLSTPFAANLQVALANTNGCPITTGVAGVPVTFSAPSTGAGGTFSASGTSTITVGATATGSANAPTFTANDVSGAYVVTASSEFGSVTFSLANTAAGVPARITAVTPRQSATVGSRYGKPLRVKVLDADGNPVAGASVAFSLGSGTSGSGGGGGSSAGASFGSGGTQATAVTSSAGLATSPSFSANTVAGRFTATAETNGVVEPAAFAFENRAAKAPIIRAVGRARQSATVDARYRSPLVVEVTRADGAPLQGATVTFSLGSGGTGGTDAPGPGASFAGGSAQATDVTDASGKARSPRFTANGVAGAFTATASIAGVSEPASFSLDNLASKAPTVAATEGRRLAAVVKTRYSQPLRVKVTDAKGQPVQGASVTFSLGSGSGSGSGASSAGATFVDGAAQATETTDASGTATSPAMTANSTTGTFTATASISNGAGAAGFTLRNLPGKAAAVTPGAASGASTAAGSAFPVRLAVTVTDADGNAVPGARVTFAAPAHGPTGRFGGHRRSVTVETNASGVAVAPHFSAGDQQGGYIVKARVEGTGQVAAFALVNEPRGT